MLARMLLMFLLFASVFFGLYWVVFRTKLLNKGLVLEITKTATITAIAIVSAAVAIALIMLAEFF